jgi:hypothetical protein
MMPRYLYYLKLSLLFLLISETSLLAAVIKCEYKENHPVVFISDGISQSLTFDKPGFQIYQIKNNETVELLAADELFEETKELNSFFPFKKFDDLFYQSLALPFDHPILLRVYGHEPLMDGLRGTVFVHSYLSANALSVQMLMQFDTNIVSAIMHTPCIRVDN